MIQSWRRAAWCLNFLHLLLYTWEFVPNGAQCEKHILISIFYDTMCIKISIRHIIMFTNFLVYFFLSLQHSWHRQSNTIELNWWFNEWLKRNMDDALMFKMSLYLKILPSWLFLTQPPLACSPYHLCHELPKSNIYIMPGIGGIASFTAAGGMLSFFLWH